MLQFPSTGAFSLLLLLFLRTTVVSSASFTPGCSFVGGQCMYTVQLGHQGQCDTSSSSSTGPVRIVDSSSPTCCGDVSQLRSDFTALKRQVEDMRQTLQGNNQNLTNAQAALTQLEADKQNLVLALQQKEAELNNTQKELSRLLGQASQEIQGLRTDLTNATRDLKTCQAALGVTSTGSFPASTPGNIQKTYCGFNNGTADWCVFSNLSSGVRFTLMNKGTSSRTGPKVEHSTGTTTEGWYMGLNSRDVSPRGSYGRILDGKVESTYFEPANAYCIMFYFTMYGTYLQYLRVTTRIGGGVGYPVYVASTTSHDGWQYAQIELDSEYTSHRFKIDFEAAARANYDSDVAIDDVYVYNATCAAVLQCPPGASRLTDPSTNETTCYTFHPTPMTWTQASDACRQEGPKSALVAINSLEEQTFLVNTIKSDAALHTVGQNGFYTSGNDLYVEHSFYWTNRGSLDRMTYTNWHTGQPNNVGGNQNCLLMEYPDDGYSWGDVDCDTTHPFICEAKYN